LKIKLVGDPTGAPIGPLNAFLRDIVHIVDGLAYIGYLWPLWDEKRQTFADKLMGTIVVDAPVPNSTEGPH
ncbi:RDD family protein, partial [Dietzia sp. PP-33]|uniref:RDD family protein n=1 Tax=Dietzia sp. PP-33 TaxID=2957500 RepID=UPI0029A218B4